MYGLFWKLYNILKGCHKWLRKKNVSCGSVVNIRVRSVIVEGINTLEGDLNVVRIKCIIMRLREWIRTDMKLI